MECDLPDYFNYRSNSCEKCSMGFVFNLITKLCGYPPLNTNSAGGNICCGTIIKNPEYETCPESTPFYNGKQCINCDSPAYFDLETYSCEFCPEGQGFSKKSHRCIDLAYLEPMHNSTITPANQNYMGIPPTIPEKYENIINCDEATPFYDKRECIKCQSPSYFSFYTNQCLACSDEEIFSVEFHKCVGKDTDKYNNNMTAINNFRGKVKPFDPSLATCPGGRPFFNGHRCI